MGQHAEFLQWYYNTVGKYDDINQSEWFKALSKNAYRNSERNGNRIYIYFKTEDLANECIAEAERRNIKCYSPMHDLYNDDYRVDIQMIWKKCKPSCKDRKQPQILD